MDAIKDSISRYSANFESLRDDIVSGIKEGVEEGIKEGVKKGFIDGIKDCLDLGFSNIGKVKIKTFKKILVDAFGNASEKSIRSSIKKTVEKEYKSMINSSVKKYMEKTCNTMVETIRTSTIRLDSKSSKDIKDLLTLSTKKISDEIGEINNKVREKLPTDIIFGSVVDGMQEGFEETFNENIKICEERIGREIEKKATSVEV